MKRLREKSLYFPSPRDRQLVVLGELVHAKNGNDVLQILVALENDLYLARHIVVLFPDNVRIENTRCRIEGIDGRINSQLSDLARQNRGGVEMGECRRRRRVGQVVGRDINRL